MKTGLLGYIWAVIGAVGAVSLLLIALSTRYDPLTVGDTPTNCIPGDGSVVCFVLDRWSGSAQPVRMERLPPTSD